MNGVFFVRTHSIEPDSYWSASLGDLVLQAGAPAIEGLDIDAVFAASMRGQSDAACLAADRLGLKPAIALTLEAGDVSGMAALQAAYLSIRGGGSRTALVIGAAKVSDLSEEERLALLDQTLDREAAGDIAFTTQAGLLAAHCCKTRGLDSGAFVEISAANHAAWAKHQSRPAPTVAEFKRDLIASPPLVRSDFAQLLDGACAVVLSADEKGTRGRIDGAESATDLMNLWERADPLGLAAIDALLARLRLDCEHLHIEVDAAVSVIEYLARDVTRRSLARQSQYKVSTPIEIPNIRGGAQGRGRVLGASSLYQVEDLYEAGSKDNLLLAVAGLGHHIIAARISKGNP